MSESVTVSDTGLHLPVAEGDGSSSSTAPPPLDSTSLLSSLFSLPPRAQKRRRGERFKQEDANSTLTNEQYAAATMNGNIPATSGGQRQEEEKQVIQRPVRERKFEYLDHTADIQLHSWGSTLTEALEQSVLAMFSYITDLGKVDIDPTMTDTFEVKGHDLDSLLFTLLDEFLYRFATNEWIPRDLTIDSLDLDNFTIRVTGYGEHFTLAKHPQGTEIKAITYSNMQIYVNGKRVRSDNDENRKRTKMDESEGSESSLNQSQGESSQRAEHGADIYVIVDI